MKLSGFIRRSRHIADLRIGFVIHSDRCNVILSDWDEDASKFNFGITLCLLWVNCGVTIYVR